MNTTDGKNLRVVFYEGPGSAPIAEEDRYRAISSLLQNGFEVSRPATGGSVAPADGAPMLVLGRFESDRAPQIEGAGELHVKDLRGWTPTASSAPPATSGRSRAPGSSKPGSRGSR